MAQHFTDFSEQASNAFPSGWTQFLGNAGQWLVKDSVGATGDKVLRYVRLGSSGGYRAYIFLDAAGEEEIVEIVFRFRLSGSEPGNFGMSGGWGAIRLASTDWASSDGYLSWFLRGSSFAVRMQYAAFNGGTSALGGGDIAPRWSASNVWWRQRFQIQGRTIKRSRTWLDTDPEPGTWDHDINSADSTNVANIGRAGLWAHDVSGRSLDIDWFGVGTGGDTAPHEPVVTNQRPDATTLGTENVTQTGFDITASGNDPDGDPIVYRQVQLSSAGGDESTFLAGLITDTGTTAAPAASYGVSGLSPSTTRYFRARDADAVGFGDWSAIQSETTLPLVPPTADTITGELDLGLARINVTVEGTGGVTARTLEASLTNDFASFDTVTQFLDGEPTTDPAETLLMWHAGNTGTEVFFRSRVFNPDGSTVSNVVSVEFPAVPAAAEPTVDVVAVGEDFVNATISAAVLPEGHVLSSVLWVIRSGGTIVKEEPIPIADPDDPDEPWRDVMIDGLGPSGASLTIEGRYLSNSTPDGSPTIVTGAVSDAEPFTLLDAAPTPGVELDGEPTVTAWTYFREWPVSQYRASIQYPPQPPDFNSFYITIERLGEVVHTRRTKSASGLFGALMPGLSYDFSIYAWWFDNVLNHGYTPTVEITITPPLVLDAPYLDTIGGIIPRSGQNFTGIVEIVLKGHDHPAAVFAAHDPLVAGTWPIEITFDRGATWTELTVDARGIPYSWDTTLLDPSRFQLRYRTVPAEGDPSVWRYSRPFNVNRSGVAFVHKSGVSLLLADFTARGDGDWDELGEDEDTHLAFSSPTGAVVGGALELNGFGNPRNFSVIVEAEYSGGVTSIGPIGGFSSDLSSAMGGGGHLVESSPSALLGIAASAFGAWGGWKQNLIGEGSSDWWPSVRYGLGTHKIYGSLLGSTFLPATFNTGPSGPQWLGGARSMVAATLRPKYTLEMRFTQLSNSTDGRFRHRVQVYMQGPGWDSTGEPQIDVILSLVTDLPLGPPAIYGKAKSTILYHAFTVDSEDEIEDPEPEPLPETLETFTGRLFLRPCESFALVSWYPQIEGAVYKLYIEQDGSGVWDPIDGADAEPGPNYVLDVTGFDPGVYRVTIEVWIDGVFTGTYAITNSIYVNDVVVLDSAPINPTKIAHVEVWEDLGCTCSERLAFLETLQAESIEQLESAEQAIVEVPLTSAGWPYVREKRVLRFIYENMTWQEWRILRVTSLRLPDGSMLGRIECESPMYDLGSGITEQVQVPTDEGRMVEHHYDLFGLTPAQHMANILSYARPCFVVGTIETEETMDLSYYGETPLQLINKLAESTLPYALEYDVVRTVSGHYRVDLVEQIGEDATVAHLRYSKNERSLEREADASESFQRVYPLGQDVEGWRMHMGGAEWEIASIDGTSIVLAGGAIAFDDQLNGMYLENTLTPDARVEITDTVYDTQTIVVASAVGFAVNDLVRVRRDSEGTELTYMQNPAAAVEYGGSQSNLWPWRVPLDASDIPPIDNHVRNPFGDIWDEIGPLNWVVVNGATISKNVEALYKRYGSASIRVVAAADGEGVETDWEPLRPTENRPYGSAQAALFVRSGQVRMVLEYADGPPEDGGTTITSVIPGSEDKVFTSMLNQWTDGDKMLAIGGVDFYALGAKWVRLRIEAKDGAAEWYIDAVQITRDASPWDQYYHGRASNDLWNRANRWLREYSTPRLSYRGSFVDFQRIAENDYPFDALRKGAQSVIRDEGLAIDTRVRLVSIRRDLHVPGNTSLELSTLRPDLTQVIVDAPRRARRSSRSNPTSSPPPPPPPSMEITLVSAVLINDGELTITYRVSWMVVNPLGGVTYSLERDMSTDTSGGWTGYQEVVTDLNSSTRIHDDVITKDFNSGYFKWRVRAWDGDIMVAEQESEEYVYID